MHIQYVILWKNKNENIVKMCVVDEMLEKKS